MGSRNFGAKAAVHAIISEFRTGDKVAAVRKLIEMPVKTRGILALNVAEAMDALPNKSDRLRFIREIENQAYKSNGNPLEGIGYGGKNDRR